LQSWRPIAIRAGHHVPAASQLHVREDVTNKGQSHIINDTQVIFSHFNLAGGVISVIMSRTFFNGKKLSGKMASWKTLN
jgi:hypothetical protein